MEIHPIKSDISVHMTQIGQISVNSRNHMKLKRFNSNWGHVHMWLSDGIWIEPLLVQRVQHHLHLFVSIFRSGWGLNPIHYLPCANTQRRGTLHHCPRPHLWLSMSMCAGYRQHIVHTGSSWWWEEPEVKWSFHHIVLLLASSTHYTHSARIFGHICFPL